MTTSQAVNPPAVPARDQTLEQLAPRMNEARTALLRAVQSGAVTWHRPPTGQQSSHCVWDRGTKRPAGEKRMKTVTGEVNWLRSHGLSKLGKNANAPGTIKTIAITDRGTALLELIA